MKKLKLLSLSLIAAASLFGVSCTKTGAKGDTGAAGATGATGAAGPDSVYYSAPVTLQMTETTDSNGNTDVYVDTINAPEITASLINSSELQGYLYVPGPLGDSAYLPLTYYSFGDIVEYQKVGKIILSTWGIDLSGYQYRYVLIPAGISVSSADGRNTISPAALNKMDYNTLMAQLGAQVSSRHGAVKVTLAH